MHDTVVVASDSARFKFTPAVPSYDRVNGLTLRAGASLRLARAGAFRTDLGGSLAYRTASERFGAGVDLAAGTPRTLFAIGAERDVLTNEGWVRGATSNTLSFVVAGKDYRNYYEADRIHAEIAHAFRPSPTFTLGMTVRAQHERARSLAAHNPWVLQDRRFRENPAIDAGDIASLFFGSQAGITGRRQAFAVSGAVEVARKVAGGDVAFNRITGSAEYATRVVANHALSVWVHAQGPLPGTDALPLQRWSYVGGAPALHTFPIAFFRGDRIVATRVEYLIPGSRRLRVPFFGIPDLTLVHSSGMAWTEEGKARLHQNVGAQVQLFAFYARVLFDPAPTDGGADRKFSFGVKLPDSHMPWEALGEVVRNPRLRSRYGAW